MSDLADKVIKANSVKSPKYEVDELGLGIANTPDYIAARAIYRNTLDREKDPNAPLLHTRKNRTEIWLGSKQLFRTAQTMYELTAMRRNLKPHELYLVWESLLKNLPELDTTKIAVSPHYYWDIEKGELCYTEERLMGI